MLLEVVIEILPPTLHLMSNPFHKEKQVFFHRHLQNALSKSDTEMMVKWLSLFFSYHKHNECIRAERLLFLICCAFEYSLHKSISLLFPSDIDLEGSD